MNYTVSLLKTQADCQTLIDLTESDKAGLAYRKTGIERQRESVEKNSVDIDAELASAVAEVNALQIVIDGLPDGDVKDDTVIRFKKADLKRIVLEKRKVNSGVLSMLTKEYDIACIEKDIQEADAFIAVVTARMNELPPAVQN